MPDLTRFETRQAITEMGHEDQFPSLRPRDRCRFGQATFTGTQNGGASAAPERLISTKRRSFAADERRDRGGGLNPSPHPRF
jgi:hypothetical protein